MSKNECSLAFVIRDFRFAVILAVARSLLPNASQSQDKCSASLIDTYLLMLSAISAKTPSIRPAKFQDRLCSCGLNKSSASPN